MSKISTFKKLGLNKALLAALTELGYETPTTVQEQSIPIILEGHDLLSQAQTGTGKTAAFALPVLQQIDLSIHDPQVLVIAPTRELAIQVAEAFQSYAKHLKDFHVAPIYGGQEYRTQLRALKRGAHVIVGTPGRIMDHMRRGSLSLDSLKTIILDEADEMLRMGFVDDIEWILGQIKGKHQTALFSATMPAPIQKIAKRYLKDAKMVKTKSEQRTVDNIEQSYMCVSRDHKLDGLTRYLEIEDFQAVIIFVRTKTYSTELAEKLQARGYAAAAMNGDMNQNMREKTINRFKKGSLDIVIATDVAARGIDVDRVSHVVNFDIPYDLEPYIHRIGRTGRAGRKGKALLIVTPRERRLLSDLERGLQQKISKIDPPSLQEMTEKRSQQLATKVIGLATKSKKIIPYQKMVEEIMAMGECSAEDIAASLAYLLQQANPLPSEDLTVAEEDYGSSPRKKRRRRSNASGELPRRGRSSGRGKPPTGRGRASGSGGKSSSTASKKRRSPGIKGSKPTKKKVRKG